ncbi:DUF445 family protein [Candidatus Pacearchaeota archaeon]|nr:DUF445 family protein [Candidatus Pacearchaeota archaeon]MBD3283335.1 DUF445 family protein [Candidatus Pacearchaeota archaeon]
MIYKIIAMPVIGFIIGYLTNYIAVKLLFHPRNKILGIQGILPKRKKQLAGKIADISPEIIMPEFRKIEKIPIIGEKIINAFQRAVEKQINSLSLNELEKLIYKVIKKELKFIVWIGGILGFLIGCIQSLILLI